jgi:hypothetical protein
MSTISKLTRLDYVVTLMSCMIFLSFWLVIATFPNFYFVNPQDQIDPLRRAELIFSTIGWISISTICPMLLMIYSFGFHKVIKIIPWSGIIWPLSLLISQVTSYIQTGYFYLEYLTNFPILIFTDLVLPILILFIWLDLRLKRPSTTPIVNYLA